MNTCRVTLGEEDEQADVGGRAEDQLARPKSLVRTGLGKFISPIEQATSNCTHTQMRL